MKKAIKIFLYIFGSFALIVLLAFAFHDSIIRFSLKKLISGKSNGQVELTIESFNLNLTEGLIVIEKPGLLLENVYMNETKSIQLDKVLFEKIEIDRLGIKALIFDRDILAKKLLIDKPEFWLTEQGNKSKSSFHPDKLINALNQNPDMFSRILFRIDDIEIHYGSIMLSEFTAPDADPGLVDFTIMLDHFDSQPDDTVSGNRILFSDEFRFRLKNLHKDLKSGYTLDIDSAVFSSTKNDLIVGGASLQPTLKNLEQNSVGIKASLIKLNDIGLEEVTGIEDLSLRSIIIADGEFVNFNNVKTRANKDTTATAGLNQLSKLLYDFRLDSIDISNFNYFNVRDFTDTVIKTYDLEFLMTDIEIDSGEFNDLFYNLHYKDISLSTGPFAIKQLIPNLTIDYNGLSYSSDSRDLRLSGIHLKSDTTQNNLNAIDLQIPGLQVSGVSLAELQKRKKQHLTINITDPVGNIDLSGYDNDDSSSRKKMIFPGYLLLDKIVLSKGDFNVSKKDDFFVGISGLDIELDGLKLPERENEQFSYQEISFSYNKIDSYFNKASTGFSSGEMAYQHDTLWINNIHLNPESLGKDGNLEIQKIQLNGFDIERLATENELQLGQLVVSNPQLKGDISFKSIGESPSHPTTMPLAFDIGGVDITNGKLDTKLVLKKEEIDLETVYNLKLGALNANKGDSLKSFIKDIRWRLNLNDFYATAANHRISAQHILTDAFSSELNFAHLNVSALPSALLDTAKIAIRSLYMPRLNFTGLDYHLLINQDSIAFGSVLLDSLNLDIRLPRSSPDEKLVEEKKPDLRDYIIFSYDTIVASKLHVVLEKPGKASSKHIRLKDFNIAHHYGDKNGQNFLNNFGFHFSEFIQYDSLANRFISIQEGQLNLDEDDLIINSIRGGSIIDKVDKASVAGSSGMLFATENIRLNNITIEEKLPTSLKVGELIIGDFDLQLKQVPHKQKKTSFKINLDMMDRFSGIMTRLNVDTAKLEDISLTYQTLEDTSMHTIDFDSISLIVHQINFDTAMIGQSRPNLINNLTVDLHGKTMISGDSLYEFQTGRLHYDFPNHRITVDSVHMIPRYDEETFFKKAIYQTTRTKLFSQKIEINDINIDEIFHNDHIYLGEVNVYMMNAEMYRDKRIEIKPGTFKKLPREGLMSLSQKFTIDSLHVINSYLKYKQIEDKSFVPGEIHFTHINANAYNFTNMLKEGERKNLKVEANASIMDNARIDVTAFFPLHNDSTAFWLAAKTETIDLTVLNSMTTNLLGLGISRGEGSVDAQFISGTDSLAHGNLIFRYKKLELKRYNRKKSQLKKKGFINFLINDLVVKSNNPKFARKPRVGQVYFVRETEKGVVAYLFRSLLTGLTSTLGFNNKEQRMERKEDKKRQ